MKVDKKVLANTSAAWIGVIYLACGFFVAVLPGLTRAITQSWFHGIDILEIWSAKPFPGNFLLGLISAVAAAWVAGWTFAECYNFFLGKEKK